MTDNLTRDINAICRLEGDFVLRSGRRATHYFDKYRFESDPGVLARVAAGLLRRLPVGAEVLAGLELGGVPIATAMSLQSGLPAVFVRKQAKTYGTCRAVEGADIRGRRVVMIEDVITTGGAVADAATLLKADGAELEHVLCAIWRGEGPPRIADAPELRVTPLLTEAELSVA